MNDKVIYVQVAGAVKDYRVPITVAAQEQIAANHAPATHAIGHRLWHGLLEAVKAQSTHPKRSHPYLHAEGKYRAHARQLALNFGMAATFWEIEAWNVFHAAAKDI